MALRTSLILSVAWLVTAMYTLSWYDLIAWLPLAVLAASKLDRMMLLRITLLSLSYVPGRAVEMSMPLEAVSGVFRYGISPLVQVAVLVAIVLWWRSRIGRSSSPSGHPRRSASCNRSGSSESQMSNLESRISNLESRVPRHHERIARARSARELDRPHPTLARQITIRRDTTQEPGETGSKPVVKPETDAGRHGPPR